MRILSVPGSIGTFDEILLWLNKSGVDAATVEVVYTVGEEMPKTALVLLFQLPLSAADTRALAQTAIEHHLTTQSGERNSVECRILQSQRTSAHPERN